LHQRATTSRPCATSCRYVIKPARKEKNGRGRNGTNCWDKSRHRIAPRISWTSQGYSVENFSVVQQACLLHGAARQKSGKIPVILLIHSQAPRRHGRAANVADATAGPRPRPAKQIIRPKMVKRPAETKDPSGGTTGRVKLYGRWGGWALAPNTASLGRDYRSHSDRSRRPRETFKAPADFFNFSSWVFSAEKLFRGAMIGGACYSGHRLA
jgi:hypothetical protein